MMHVLSFFRSFFVFFALVGTIWGEAGDASVATWRYNAQAAYTLTFDDNKTDQVNYIAPALSERGLKGTFFVNPDYDAMWTWRMLQDSYVQLVSDGHELGSHMMRHQSVIPNDPAWPDDCVASLEELEADCIEAKAVLESLVPGSKTVSFCYPFGRNNAEARDVIGRHFLSARAVHTYTNRPSGHFTPNPSSPPDMLQFGCFLAEGNGSSGAPSFRGYDESTAAFAAYISDTLAAGGWAIEYRHNLWGTHQAAYWEHLDELQVLSEDGVLWNGTQGEVAKYIYSRDAARLVSLGVAENSISLVLDDLLDDTVFDIPLTINVGIPADWAGSDCTILHGTASLAVTPYWKEGEAFVSFDALADGAPITISPGLSTVPEPGGFVLMFAGLFMGAGLRLQSRLGSRRASA